jgi:2-polyprenyl-3-methyl-5-hydroxy-6-metoxy-1,4-benzoquinol methylase
MCAGYGEITLCRIKSNFSSGQNEIQNTGRETLERMASVDRYNAWIYKVIKPWLGLRILEVGCGIGNMTRYFLKNSRQVVALDVLPESVACVRQQYSLLALEGDICDDSVVEKLHAEYDFDTVVCLNVLEHIPDDGKALKNMFRLLKLGGHLVLYVPAGNYLYGTLDEALGHYRRYNRQQFHDVVSGQGYKIEKIFYMNVAGIFGWYLNSKILKRRILSEKMLSLFNLLTPLFTLVECVIKPPFGQSLVCIAGKDSEEN